ncbi:hypothetical protein [Halocatena marina]|uniref:hypothetical protein n=1 Tax=Halocatena marina TaxID=2934937 RepID=UPI00200CA396|nr:hypothetical protein [Halocatena marina]
MVSPHEAWTDTELGYEYEGISVKVLPSYIESWETGIYAKDGVDRDNANAFSVHYDEGAYGVARQLVAFSDERTAWEFANLFTRYSAYRHESPTSPDPEFAYQELTRSDPHDPQSQWTSPAIVEDLSAREVLEKMAARYAFRVEWLIRDIDTADTNRDNI